jgi:asparagine synthase (glutamine-hydrolysing)
MCGIAAILAGHTAGGEQTLSMLDSMVAAQHHRGPDGRGIYFDADAAAGLGHTRLSIIDLSEAGRQPMSGASGRLRITFNGEAYNYLEIRRELESSRTFRTRTDTEVVLAAYEKWGAACLDHLVGMFAFAIWDAETRELFAARDRFGVKPLYYCQRPDGSLLIASEIKALHAAGVCARPNHSAWATYLCTGLCDHSEQTFWGGIKSLPAGHCLRWKDGVTQIRKWYDLAERVGPECDERPLEVVEEEYRALLVESVRLRFRSDVPVGISLSGGLDSSTLLGLVRAVQGADSDVKAFTFVTGDERYDELPWVRQMLASTNHPLVICPVAPQDVPSLAESAQAHQDEPFGGLPTLAYARLFEHARALGVIVLLDGQGMDEQWGGYDYYRLSESGPDAGVVQGVVSRPVRPDCLAPDFRQLAERPLMPRPFGDYLRDLQYRDATVTKMPRALRFNDRVSMRSSAELREPFLDHRLFELALRQPGDRKINGGTRKWLLRRIARRTLPGPVTEAPKRAMQTPQREWLRGPLQDWARELVAEALQEYGGTWLDKKKVSAACENYFGAGGDNSFFLWQWINLGLMARRASRWSASTAPASTPLTEARANPVGAYREP